MSRGRRRVDAARLEQLELVRVQAVELPDVPVQRPGQRDRRARIQPPRGQHGRERVEVRVGVGDDDVHASRLDPRGRIPPSGGCARGDPRPRCVWGSAATVSRTSRLVLAALTSRSCSSRPPRGALVGPIAHRAGRRRDTRTPSPRSGGMPSQDAASYEFELAGDPAFNSPILNLTTKNTRATAKDARRQRDLLLAGARRDGTGRPGSLVRGPGVRPGVDGEALAARADGRRDDHVPERGARAQLERRARRRQVPRQGGHRPRAGLARLGGEPFETAATSFTLNDPLAPGTYYWGIVPPGRGGPRGRPVGGGVVHLGLAVGDDAERDRSRRRAGGLRPAASPGISSGRGGLRRRGQLLVGLGESSKVCCDPIKGQIDDARHRVHAREDPRQQHVLLAGAGDRPEQQRRRLERRPDLHEDVRQRPAGHRAEHQEPAHARQRRRPGDRLRRRAPPSSTRPCRSSPGMPCPERPATR